MKEYEKTKQSTKTRESENMTREDKTTKRINFHWPFLFSSLALSLPLLLWERRVELKKERNQWKCKKTEIEQQTKWKEKDWILLLWWSRKEATD